MELLGETSHFKFHLSAISLLSPFLSSFFGLCFSSLLFAFHSHTFSPFTSPFSVFPSHFLLLLLSSPLAPGISFTPLIHTSSSHILSLLQVRQLNCRRKLGVLPGGCHVESKVAMLWAGGSGPITDMQGTKADPNQEEARSSGLVPVFPKQVSSLFGSVAPSPALLCLWPRSLPFSSSLPAPTFPAGLPPEARCWVNGKTTFANIKGRLFRKGRPWWDAEEACTLTRATSYLGKLGLPCLCRFPALPRGLQQRGRSPLGGRGAGGPIITHRHHQHFLETQSHWFFFFFPPPGDLMGEPRPISKALQKAASALGLCLWTHLARNLGPLPCNPFEDSRTQDGLAILTQMWIKGKDN